MFKVGDKVIQINRHYGVSGIGWKGIVTDAREVYTYVLFDLHPAHSLALDNSDLKLIGRREDFVAYNAKNLPEVYETNE